MQNMITIGTLFAGPKILTHFHSTSSTEGVQSPLNRLQFEIANLLTNTSSQLGENGRFICSDILGDNAWISALALTILLKNKPIFEKNPAEAAAALLGLSAVCWLIRCGLASYLSKTTPSLVPWIAPTHFSQENQILSLSPLTSYRTLETSAVNPAQKALTDRLSRIKTQSDS